MAAFQLAKVSAVAVALGALACSRPVKPSVPASHVEPSQERLLTGETVKVSEHVWAILGWPNVGIVVGETATLVVDTGLGKRNGATVAEAAKKLAPENRLFVTTTHFHPEHAAGIRGFPAGTLLVRNRVQEDEMVQHGEEMIGLFSKMKPSWGSLLVGEQLRAPDATFDRELALHLGGGVTARIMWLGAAHTRGDQVVFVEPDRTLISGDVVQNKVGPFIHGEGGTAASWIAAVDAIAKLGPQRVLPDHSPVGDGALVGQELAFLREVRDRALTLREQHEGVEAAGRRLTIEFEKRYPDWTIGDLTSFVKAAYGE